MDHKDPIALAAQAILHWGLYESPVAVMPVMKDSTSKENVNTVRADRGGQGG
jgi:hypothetical protein